LLGLIVLINSSEGLITGSFLLYFHNKGRIAVENVVTASFKDKYSAISITSSGQATIF
jgi:hypothetical protein